MDVLINFWMAMAMYYATSADRLERQYMELALAEAYLPPDVGADFERALYGSTFLYSHDDRDWEYEINPSDLDDV